MRHKFKISQVCTKDFHTPFSIIILFSLEKSK